MDTYIEWLKSQGLEHNTNYKSLVDIHNNNKDSWDDLGDDIYKLRVFVFEKNESLIGPLDSSWIDWKQMQQKGDKDLWAKIILLLLVLIIAFILAYVILEIFDPETKLLTLLSEVNYARGLITSLFAFGTIILSLILVLSTIFSRPGNDREFNYRKERFNQAKEVLALLLGILGTIVGFYFGAASNASTSEINAKAGYNHILESGYVYSTVVGENILLFC